MIDPLTLAAFVPATLALNLTPGADMMFCVGQGLRSGPRAAWSASAGVAVGGLVHVLIAGAGLSALLAEWPLAFDIIRWVGVAYLLWLAYGALTAPAVAAELPPRRQRAAFWSGLFVNLTNPKVILFVLAFVPQFIVPEAGPVIWQFALLGVIMASGGFVVNGFAGMSAGSIGERFARGSRMLDKVTAGVFAALAVRLALLERT